MGYGKRNQEQVRCKGKRKDFKEISLRIALFRKEIIHQKRSDRKVFSISFRCENQRREGIRCLTRGCAEECPFERGFYWCV